MCLRSIVALTLMASLESLAQERSEPAETGKAALRTVVDVPMPGPPVRFDYQSLDRTTGRLYIAHMNADQLVVFDTVSRTVIANLDGFPRIHGVWAVPELGRVYASVTGGKRVDVVDDKTLKVISQVGPVFYPDGLGTRPAPSESSYRTNMARRTLSLIPPPAGCSPVSRWEVWPVTPFTTPGVDGFWCRCTTATSLLLSIPSRCVSPDAIGCEV